MLTNNLDPNVHRVTDTMAATGIIGTLIGVLPVLAAVIGIVYYLILIYESKTVQGWLDRRRKAHRVKQFSANRGSRAGRGHLQARLERAREHARRP